jgi:fermentation-respiration switch protein FrsA (DUF1100 family)/predicted ester cyclase
MRRDISFPSEGVECRGWLYVPDDLAKGQKAPAIIMANAISAIKEITLPGYAERFCKAGFVVLVFDYRNYGSSDGTPRNHLDPHTQQQDVRNGITWLRTQPEVDANRIGGWGVSLGGVHMLYLGAYDRRLKAVVSVATGLNTLEAAMGRTGLQSFLGFVNADRDRRAVTGEIATYIPAVSMPGEGGLMAIPEANDFYKEAMSSYAPTYENRITLASVENMVADRSADAIGLIAPTALLMIHGEKDIIPPAMVRQVFEQAGEPKKLVIYDCLHTDLYVREPWVTQAADEAIAWFNRYLHNSKGDPTFRHDLERNKQVIRQLYERSNAGDYSAYDELLAPDFISYSSAARQEVRGIDAFKTVNQMYVNAFPDFWLGIDLIMAENDLVTVYGTAKGTFQGALLGHQPNGKTAYWTGIAIYRFNDEGKIDGRWQEFDGLSMFTQLGIIPPVFGGSA